MKREDNQIILSVYDQIMVAWGVQIRRNPDRRLGQNLVNAIHNVSSTVYMKLMEPAVREIYDCFYEDSKIQLTFDWLSREAK